MSASEFLRLLEDGDVEGLCRYSAAHLPAARQPASREDAEIAMHGARTAAEQVSLRKRAWSHRWLCERGLPSKLPEHLRPKAEQMFLPVQIGVGISVGRARFYPQAAELRPAFNEIQTAMEHAVLDAQAEGKLADAPFVKSRIMEARARTRKMLFGRWGTSV
jgi:hypothetical protein